VNKKRAFIRAGVLSSAILSSLLVLQACKPGDPGIDPAFARVDIPGGIPKENIVLEVTGLVGDRAAIALDLDTVMRFPRASFSSLDPWDNKTHEYSGVLLLPLLRRLGMPETAVSIEVIAANGYQASIRASDLATKGYLLAYLMDNRAMSDQPSLVKRGKLAIAINFTANPAIDVEVYKNQLVWQVRKIEVR
jgi:hypothetical protein